MSIVDQTSEQPVLSAPQKPKRRLALLSLWFFILIIPLTLIVISGRKIFVQEAATSPEVVFVDAQNTPITQTLTSNVRVKLTSPWGVTAMDTMDHSDEMAMADVLADTSVIARIQSGTDDVNEDGGLFDTSRRDIFLGNGQSATASFAGLRFTNVSIPKGAIIKSAFLEVYTRQDTRAAISMNLYADNSGNSQQFTATSKPSNRLKTTNSVTLTNTTLWKRNTWAKVTDIKSVVQEIVNRTDWKAGNSLSVIAKGTGSVGVRRYINSYNGIIRSAPRLTIVYSASSFPNSVPTATATPRPSPTASPTSLPFTMSVTLAEDSGFTQNVKAISPYTTNPQYVSYSFSNITAGTKTLFAKFRSSTGEERIFNSTINLVSSSGSIATPTVSAGTGGTSGVNSMAMGKWSPTKWDTCTKEQHDAYRVQGPDGKWYPTWHPPLGSGGCKFGHEHGRDPKGFQYWNELQKHYAYDANTNGTIETSELATAGIPFGYVNEQMDAYYASNPTLPVVMRHEDHVGHKIEFANGEGDIGEGTDPFDSSMTGGVVVPVKSTKAGVKWEESGIRCYHFQKVHQGVHSPDALSNNLHELLVYTKCTSTRVDFPASTTILSGMVQFGAPGEFTKFCGEDRDTIIKTSLTDANRYFPGVSGVGFRNVIDRSCVEQTLLVQPPAFSDNAYEDWSGDLNVRTTAGQTIATNGGAWEVLDSIRYYNPASANKISYMADLCYENFNGRIFRGGRCDTMTQWGSIKGITWDDPRSEFRGIHRGQYINQHTIRNNGGAEYWYTDAFGNKAQRTPFAGSIRQYISPVEALTRFSSDPRIIQRYHNSGGETVHAPN